MPECLSLVWGHSWYFAILQFLKLFSSPNFHPIHLHFIQSILIIQAITFLVICQKIKKYIEVLRGELIGSVVHSLHQNELKTKMCTCNTL